MTITLVGDGGLSALTSTTSLPVTLPTGIQVGDVLVAWITTKGTSATISAPTGWTAGATQANQTSTHRARAYYRVARSTETTPSFTGTVAGLMYGTISAWRGVDTGTPIDAAGSSDTAAAAATASAPSITTVTNNAVAIFLFSTPDDNSLTTPGQGTLGYAAVTTKSTDGAHGMVYLTKATAGATGTTSLTQATNGNDNWNLTTLALRPAADAANPSLTWFPGTGVQVAVEVAFDTNPLTGSPIWTDITSDVLEFTTRRGRSSEWEQTSPGTASFVLANADRKYDPEYAAGTYYGKLTPMREVRVRTRYSSTNYNVWRGLIQSWPQSYYPPRWATCEPSAIDAFSVLANRTLQDTAYASTVLPDGPALYWPLRDESATVLADLSGNGLHGTASGNVAAAASVLPMETLATGSRNIVAPGSITGPATSGEPVTIEAWLNPSSSSISMNVQSASSTTSSIVLRVEPSDLGSCQLFVYFSNTTSNVYNASPALTDFPTGVATHIVATSDLDSLYLYVNGALVRTVTLTSGTETDNAPVGTAVTNTSNDLSVLTVGHVAVYDRMLTAAEVLDHYQAGSNGYEWDLSGARVERILDAVGWADTARTVSTGASWLAPWRPANRSALNELQLVESTEQGRLHMGADGTVVFRDRTWKRDNTLAETSQATFSDNPGVGEYQYSELEVRAADVDMIRNVIAVSSTEGFDVTATDEASTAAYLERRYALSAALPVPNMAQHLAGSILDESADPAFRVERITVLPRGDSTVWPEVFGLDLGHRVTVERTPQDVGSAISQELAVEGIEHRVTPDDWQVSYYLAPPMVSNTTGGWFVLGDALNSGNPIPY